MQICGSFAFKFFNVCWSHLMIASQGLLPLFYRTFLIRKLFILIHISHVLSTGVIFPKIISSNINICKIKDTSFIDLGCWLFDHVST